MSDVNELAKKFAELKYSVDAKKKELAEINEQWDEVERELMDAMVEEGTNSIGVDGIGLFSLRTKNYMSVNSANHFAFFQYLREHGHGSLIRDYVPPATLTSFLKEHQAELEGKYVAEGMDQIDARNKAIDYLKTKGAACFSEKQIALTKR